MFTLDKTFLKYKLVFHFENVVQFVVLTCSIKFGTNCTMKYVTYVFKYINNMGYLVEQLFSGSN